MPNGKPDRVPAILQIVPSLDTGGAERTTVDIAKALVEKGFRALGAPGIERGYNLKDCRGAIWLAIWHALSLNILVAATNG